MVGDGVMDDQLELRDMEHRVYYTYGVRKAESDGVGTRTGDDSEGA